MGDTYINGVTTSGAPFQIGVVLNKTLSVFSSSLGRFLLLAFIPMIPLLAIALTAAAGPLTPRGGAMGGLSAILAFFLSILAQATTLYGAFQEMAGRPFSIGESLSVGFGRSLPVLGVALLSGLATGLAALLFVIPGIIVACMFYVAVPACVIEKTGVTASLDRSTALTKGYRWQIFALWALVAVVAGVAEIVLSWFGGALWGGLLSFGWQVVATAFGAVLVAVIYHDLRAAKEGIDTDSLANVFD
jgi:hypothetical protein